MHGSLMDSKNTQPAIKGIDFNFKDVG